MGIFDKLRREISDTGYSYPTPWIGDKTPIPYGQSYCRLFLASMQLAKHKEWFSTRYPSIYVNTKYRYGENIITIPYITNLATFQQVSEKNMHQIITRNVPLTPIFPYDRGDVHIQAGLFSMETNNLIDSYMTTLNRLVVSLPLPQIATTLSIATLLYNGIEDMFSKGKSSLELGYERTFTGVGGNNELSAGYFAIIGVKESELDISRLIVHDERIYIKAEEPEKITPLTGYNYMLFRIETRSQQDYESLRGITELVRRAQDAFMNQNHGAYKDLLGNIRVEIFRSPDVLKSDRNIMYAKIKQDLESLGYQSTRISTRSLYNIMQDPMPDISSETMQEIANYE